MDHDSAIAPSGGSYLGSETVLPSGDPWPHKPAAVHRCGRKYFRNLSQHSNSGHARADQDNTTERVKLALQGKSLVHCLLVVRRRLFYYLEQEMATKQDVAHYQMVLADIRQRWAAPGSGEFAACLKDVDLATQQMCCKLFHECMDLLQGLESSSVDMSPDVKDVHDKLVELKRDAQVLHRSQVIRTCDVLAVQERMALVDKEMSSCMVASPTSQVILARPEPTSAAHPGSSSRPDSTTNGAGIGQGITQPATPPQMGVFVSAAAAAPADEEATSELRSSVDLGERPSAFATAVAASKGSRSSLEGSPTSSRRGRKSIPRGQAVCADLQHDCHGLLADLWPRVHDINLPTRQLLGKLVAMRTKLLRLRQEADHTEEECATIEEVLDALAESAMSSEVETTPEAVQSLVVSLVKECKHLVGLLERSSVPMSEDMAEVHDMLARTATRLLQIKSHELHVEAEEGPLAAAMSVPLEEVKTLQHELEKLESLRLDNDGVFAGNATKGALPAGQTLCSSLLHRCYDTLAALYHTTEGAALDPVPAASGPSLPAVSPTAASQAVAAE